MEELTLEEIKLIKEANILKDLYRNVWNNTLTEILNDLYRNMWNNTLTEILNDLYRNMWNTLTEILRVIKSMKNQHF